MKPQLDTAAIEARLAAATPGPWTLRYDGWTIRDSRGNRQIAHTYGRDGSLVEQQVNDADLIAHAPTDIRALLDEVERLRAALTRLRDCDWVITPHDRMDAVRDTARAEAEAAKAELETWQMRLAACTTAALSNTPSSAAERIDASNPYYSASYGDVCAAVDREMALRAEVAEWHQVFGLYHAATARAAEAWHAANPDNDPVLPDTAEALCAYFDVAERDRSTLTPILDGEITEGDWHAKTMRVSYAVDGRITIGATLREFLAAGGVVRVVNP